MQELIDYLSAFEPTLANRVKGVSDGQLQELAARCSVSLPNDYADFLRTMGHDSGPLQFFEGNADFHFATVLDFYSSPGWRPLHGLFVGADYSGGGADYFLESQLSPDRPQVVRYPSGDDEFEPILVHPGFANMLFTLGFQSLRLARLPHQGQLLADGRKQWKQEHSGSRLDVLATLALHSGLVQVPHTGSWSVAYEGTGSGIVYYEVPGFSPSVSVGAGSATVLAALDTSLTKSLSLVRVR